MRSRGTADSNAECAPPPAAVGGGMDGREVADAGAADRAPPPSMTDKMSCLLTRPPAPVPGTCARSTLFSLASRRTNGELRIFSPAGRWGAAEGPGLAAICTGAGDAALFAESAFAASVFVG